MCHIALLGICLQIFLLLSGRYASKLKTVPCRNWQKACFIVISMFRQDFPLVKNALLLSRLLITVNKNIRAINTCFLALNFPEVIAMRESPYGFYSAVPDFLLWRANFDKRFFNSIDLPMRKYAKA